MNLRPFDGPQISLLMAGKVIAEVLKNDEVLIVRCVDGTEVRVAWVDDEGKQVKGRPAIEFAGRHVIASVAKMGARTYKAGV